MIKILSPFSTINYFRITRDQLNSRLSTASRMALSFRAGSSRAKLSSKIKAPARCNGLAPLMAKSLTAPLIAKRPMSPPGKKIGVTVKESVVNAGCVREERNCSRESPYRLLSGADSAQRMMTYDTSLTMNDTP